MKTDIFISGAGLAGLTLALDLGQKGFKVTVADPHDPLQDIDLNKQTRSSAIMLDNLDYLQRLGIDAKELEKSTAMNRLVIIDDSLGNKEKPKAEFRAEEINQDIFGQNILNDVLKLTLAKAADKNENITLVSSASVADYQATAFGVTIALDNKDRYEAKLLVGADGRNSFVRQKSGIDVWQRDYNQTAITCVLEHTKPHENTSFEIHRSGGPFTLVPMAENQSSLVWVENNKRAQQILSLTKQEIENAIQGLSLDLLGTTKLSSSPLSWPLKALKAKKMTAQRVALIAEAAHVLTPLGAQGLNLSLRDAACLADTILETAQLGLDIGNSKSLGSFEKERSHDIDFRLKGTDFLNRSVNTNNVILHDIRRTGLKTVGGLAPLKTFLMKRGMAGGG